MTSHPALRPSASLRDASEESEGVAVYQLHGVKRDELIEYADHAMYQAKHSGRNCVCVAELDLSSIQEASSLDGEKHSKLVP